MDLDNENLEPIVVLQGGMDYAGLRGSQLIVLNQDEAAWLADTDEMEGLKPDPARVFDLEHLVRWAFAHGYGNRA